VKASGMPALATSARTPACPTSPDIKALQ
jgi:hypothetical protein